MIPNSDGRRVLVTEANLRFGFNVVSSLVSSGYQVIAAAAALPTMCHGLTGLVTEFRYPDPFITPVGYIQAIVQACIHHNVGLVVPVHEDIFVASLLRQWLPHGVELLAPQFDVLMSLHDKYNLCLLTRDEEVCCPPTRVVITYVDVAEAVESIGTPMVLKPRRGEGGHGLLKIRGPRDLSRQKRSIDEMLVQQEYIAQKYCKGLGVGVAMLIRDGRVLATSQHQRLREVPISGGTSTARMTFYDERLRYTTEKLLCAAGLNGIAMAEYRLDPNTGRAWLLDVNPRYWGGLACHIESGVDYPSVHVRGFWEKTFASDVVVPTLTIESRWALGELRSIVALAAHGKWKEIGDMVNPRHKYPVIYEDFGAIAVWAQMCAYLQREWRNWFVKGRNVARREFFREAVHAGSGAAMLEVMTNREQIIARPQEMKIRATKKMKERNL